VKMSVLMMVVMVALVSGCATTEMGGDAGATTMGESVAAVVNAHAGHQVRIFDVDDKELKTLPENQPGSVSIYNKENTGQDNYVFDKSGTITRHQRSYGEDYSKGVWTKVK
jgi:hypothetical protein